MHLKWGGFGAGGLLALGATVALCALPASSGAATVVPTSFTGCHGKVSPDAKGKADDEPNLLDYSFSCNGGITAYTIFVDQTGDHGGSVDDFDDSPSVLETDDKTPSPTESVTCEGLLPSDGINCNTGAQGAQIDLGFFIAGTIDPVAAYCKHLPVATKTSKPPPGALAIPTARVELVVTDYTGAEDGPFTLPRAKACPKVPDEVPTPEGLATRTARAHGDRSR